MKVITLLSSLKFYGSQSFLSAMDKMLHRKINLLLHLAQVDGKFDATEKDLLKTVLEENGLQGDYLEEHKPAAVNLHSLAEIPGKAELLFWILKLIHADGQLHAAELAYARVVAKQLGFREEVIEYYKTQPIKSLVDFEKQVKLFTTA
jgi:uncharacterized tellurite resistance protein B-like protein